MAEEEEGWFRLWEPPDPARPLTAKMEEAIRGVAESLGYEDLRGFHRYLKMVEWDYYDVLRVASP